MIPMKPASTLILKGALKDKFEVSSMPIETFPKMKKKGSQFFQATEATYIESV